MHFEPSSVMTEKPSPEEVVRWQRRLAGQANNRAWSLSEQASRSAAEDEEMLNAAHAAMYFWSIVGNANNQAHAAQLLAQVILPFCKGVRSRNAMQPWPASALV
jgi:hypothetical protein